MSLRQHLILIVTVGLLSGPAAAQWDGAAWADYGSFISPLTGSVRNNLRSIAAAGSTQGRVTGRMGQIGDSITESSAYFRNVLLQGTNSDETGHDYDPVRSWLAYGNAQPADGSSFYNAFGKGSAYGCLGGWTLDSAIAAGHPDMGVLTGDGTVPGNFSWALIMYGTNDIDNAFNASAFKTKLKGFVQGYIDLGVVPVLSTIPPEFAHVQDGLVEVANQAIREAANEMLLLYVDYYALVLHYQPTNWKGTLISNDGTHPSAKGGGRDFSQMGLTTTDGYAARTKLTLDVAEVLRDDVFHPSSPITSESWARVKARYHN